MMRLDRLLGITMVLLSKRRVTATELASRFEVSVRTIYRDIEIINQSGIPVVSFAGTGGGYEIMSGFFLTKQHFSIDDFSVIYNLLKAAEDAVGNLKFTPLIDKVGALHPSLSNAGPRDKVIFDLSASQAEKEMIQHIMKALDQSRRITLTYTNASGKISKRKIDSLNLLWERGIWYLDGYCLSRKERRYFRVSRMTDLHILEEQFNLESDYTHPVVEEQGINVHLRFDLSVKSRVFEQFPEESINHRDYIDLETLFYSRDYAISIILSYGEKVEIISPDDLKDDLIRTLNNIQKIYL